MKVMFPIGTEVGYVNDDDVYISGLEVIDYDIVAQIKQLQNGDLRPCVNIRYTLVDDEGTLYVVYQGELNDIKNTNDTTHK